MVSKVSIIIPSFNNALLLKRALNSLLDQTYEFWEAIIIDNSSTDATIDIVNSFKDERIKFYLVNNNGIIAFSRNFGINKSTTNTIAFLDSDDWWHPKKLEISMKFIGKYDFIYHNLYLCTDKKNISRFKISKSRILNDNSFEDLLLSGNCIPNSSVIVKKDLLKSINYIDENINKYSWEDYDTWLRLAKNKIKFKKINKTLGFYWIGKNNVTNEKQIKKNIKNFLLIYNNQLNIFNLNKEPWWCPYLLGMTFKNKKDFKQSNIFFYKSIDNTVNYKLILKSYIRIIINYLNIAFSR